MPLSSHLAPGFIRLTYSGIRLPHHEIIPIKFVDTDPTPGTDPDLYTTAATTVAFSTAIDNWVSTAFKLLFPSNTRFGAADIYKVNPTTGIRTFVYTHTVAMVGTNVNTRVANQEAVWTFKTTAGKPLKVYAMESVFDVNERNVGSVPADSRQAVLDYILSADNIFFGRTDAWPLAFMTFTSKTNDVLRRNGGFTDV